MTGRPEKTHPAFVHVPIALPPLEAGAGFISVITGHGMRLSFGERATRLEAAGSVGPAASWFIAGEGANVGGTSMDMPMTHRILNFVATMLASGIAIWRTGHREPDGVHLLADIFDISSFVTYTSYLGGKLVCDADIGVERAPGVDRADAPVLKYGQIDNFLKTSATDVAMAQCTWHRKSRRGISSPTIRAGLGEQLITTTNPRVRAPATGRCQLYYRGSDHEREKP